MEVITCPGCQKPLRLPTEWLGTNTSCPHCKCHFTAPVRQADGTLSVATRLRHNPFAQSRLVLPAMLLLFFGLFTLFINTTQMLRAYTDPERFAQRTQADFEEMVRNVKDDEQRQEVLDRIPVFVKWLPPLSIVFMLQSLLSVAGAISMLRRWSHSLALLGAFAAVFHLAYFCCAGGIPVGAFALFVLFNPNARAEFSNKRATPQTP